MLEARWVEQATPWQSSEIEQSAFSRFVKQAQRYPDVIAVRRTTGQWQALFDQHRVSELTQTDFAVPNVPIS